MAPSGGALWEPMATLMIGGLGVSSVMTLVYVPALYRVLFRDAQMQIAFHPSAHQAV
jgi:multidrug efflux pump subunit AcrB